MSFVDPYLYGFVNMEKPINPIDLRFNNFGYYPVPISLTFPYSNRMYPVYFTHRYLYDIPVYPTTYSPFYGYQPYEKMSLYPGVELSNAFSGEDDENLRPLFPKVKVSNPLPDLKKKAEEEAKKLEQKAKQEAAKAAEKAKQEAAKAAQKAKEEAAKAAAKAAEKAKEEAAKAAAKAAEKAKEEAAKAAAKAAEKAKEEAAKAAAKAAEKAKEEAAKAAAKAAEKAKEEAAKAAAKAAEKAKEEAAKAAAKAAEQLKKQAEQQLKGLQKKIAHEIDFPEFKLPTKLEVGDYSLPLQIGSPCPESADSAASEYPMTTVGGVPEFKAEPCSSGVCIYMKKSKFSVTARLCHPRSIQDYARMQLEKCQEKSSQAAALAFAQSLAASSASLGAAIPAAISVALSTYKTTFTNCVTQVSELKELEKYIKLSIYAKRLSTEPWKKI